MSREEKPLAHGIGASILIVLIALTTNCKTAVSLPAVNLAQPGWTVHQGQAVWRRARGGEGVAGELLVATRNDGSAFVQFTKNPFPLVVAQKTAKAWKVEFPPQNKSYSGQGTPPQRIIFLQLPRVLSGQPPPKHWSWQRIKDHGRQLENQASGESLDVYFEP